MGRPDVVSLVSGIAIAILGLVLLLDATDSIDLRFEAFAPLVTGVLGAILLAAGLSRSSR